MLVLSALMISFSSCIDQKQFIYFQKNAGQSDTINVAQAYIPKIQPGDILSIYVSSLNPAASSFFNPLSGGTAGVGDNGTASTNLPQNVNPALSQPSASGFLVDADGTFDFPLIGTIKVAGLTTEAAKDTIKNRLKFYLKEPTVSVRFLNYKISVMGEVMHPSVYVIPNERVTLPEAISMAGDLTPFAKHDNILVIRDENGKKQFGRVNLNSRDIFNSPYYYLHSGDLVYVEQGKSKAAQNDPTLRLLPIVLSTIAALAILLYRTR